MGRRREGAYAAETDPDFVAVVEDGGEEGAPCFAVLFGVEDHGVYHAGAARFDVDDDDFCWVVVNTSFCAWDEKKLTPSCQCYHRHGT